jgi:hypothetical protein
MDKLIKDFEELNSLNSKNSEEKKIKDENEVGKICKYRVTLNVYFKESYSYEDDSSNGESEEENDSPKYSKCTDPSCFCFSLESFDIDEFMKRDYNYETFGASVMGYYEQTEEYLGQSPFSDFEYEDGGVISFIFSYKVTPSDKKAPTPDIIKKSILNDSFEDGMYEAQPGSEAVVAANYKCKDDFGYGGYHHKELGLIDCRDEDRIDIVRIN